MQKGPRTLTPGVPYLITGHEVTTGLTGVVPEGGFAPVPLPKLPALRRLVRN
jgi:hypothetical protein